MEVDSNSSCSSSEDERKKRKKIKKSKHKKQKSKEKKHKKSKKHRRHSSSSDSESGSEEDAWVEADDDKKTVVKESIKVQKPKATVTPQPTSKERSKVDDDEWSGFGSIIPTYSNDSKRNIRRKEKQDERALNSIDKAGQHDKELNPYWKDGGIGLPSEVKETKFHSGVGDGGLAWLKKSFQRAKEQAKEDGRSLEDVVSERWGSLEKFYLLLEEAENKSRGAEPERDHHSRSERSSNRFKRPSRYSDSDEDNHHRSRSSKSHSYEKSSSSRRHNERERDSRNPSWMKPGAEKKKSHREDEKYNSESMKSKLVTSHTVTREKSNASPIDKMEKEEEQEVEEPEVPAIPVLTDKEMNELNAKIFKAEMLGNSDLVLSLKNKLQEAEKAREEFVKGGGSTADAVKTKVITKVIMGSQKAGGRRVKDKITETHKDGQRVRYFPDDDRHTLKTMFEREKMNTVEDENALFSRLAGKGAKASGEYDADEIFVDKASSSKQEMKEREREVMKALDDDKQYKKVLDDCPWCFDGKHLQKNLILAIGQSSFLCVPPYQSLTEGHCLIVPMFHVTCSTQLDEDVWTEMQKFRKALIQMFKNDEQDVIFFETALSLNKQPHMYIECVPMPIETGEMAPIYFKKAIQECETEWAQNKKVVDLRERDVRRAIPKGLPYFSVEFADDTCGFAHVVEDERNFPRNFAHSIIGGMMELDHQIWRKQKMDDFHKQRSKLMGLLTLWAPYDWTREDSSGIKN